MAQIFRVAVSVDWMNTFLALYLTLAVQARADYPVAARK